MTTAPNPKEEEWTYPVGEPAITMEQAEEVDQYIAARVPSYTPGRFIESAKFYNDLKERLDTKEEGLFKTFLESQNSNFGDDPPRKGDTEEQIKEKAQNYDKDKALEAARKLLADEPDLLERYEAMVKKSATQAQSAEGQVQAQS